MRACAVYTEIYKKNAAAQSEDPDQAPAFTLTVRTPQCGHTVWGIKNRCASHGFPLQEGTLVKLGIAPGLH